MDSSYNIPPLLKLEFTNNNYFGTHANENSQKPETNTEWLFFRKGCTNYELKNYQSAHKDFCYCIYTHKDFLAEAYYLRAFVYYDTGNREQACKDLQQAALNGYDVPNDEYEIICNNSKSGSKYDK
jgi:tetratricopeptide (TPR) repeat protein